MPIITTYPFKKDPLANKDEIILSDSQSNDPNFKTKTTDLEVLMKYVKSKIQTIEPVSLDGDFKIQLTGLNGFGTAGQVLAVNQAEDALEYISGGGGGVALQKNTADVVDPANTINYQNGVKVEQDATTATTANINIVYESTLSGDPVTVEKVGGFEPNTLLSSINENTNSLMWDTLLFPTVLPEYSRSTRTLSPTSIPSKEVGIGVGVNLVYGAIKNDAGDYTRLQVSRDGTELATVSNPTGTTTNGGLMTQFDPQFNFDSPNRNNLSYSQNYSDSFTMPAPSGNDTSSTVQYTSEGDYSAGLPKKDSKGVNDTRTAGNGINQPQALRTNFSSPVRTVTGFYPYFFGQSSTYQSPAAVQALINAWAADTSSLNKVVANSVGDISIPFTNNFNGYFYFAFYDKVPDKTNWFKTTLNSGDIGGNFSPGDPAANLFNAGITLAVSSLPGFWSNIDYKIYVAPNVSVGATTLIKQ